jgi:hypothetical protein
MMPLYRLEIWKGAAEVKHEVLRAAGDVAAEAAARVRLASCGPGQSVVMLRDGVERLRLGPGAR